MSSYEYKDKIRYELDNKLTNHHIPSDCYRIDVVDASTVNAIISIDLILYNGDSIRDIDLKKGGYYESPVKIKSIKLSYDDQIEEWVDIRETDMSTPPEYVSYQTSSSELSIGSIDAPIEIKNTITTCSGESIENSYVTIGTSALEIISYQAERTRITILNNSNTGIIYIGNDSEVDLNNGFPISANQALTLETRGAIYAIGSISNIDVRYLIELSDEG